MASFNIALTLAEQARLRPSACAVSVGRESIGYADLATAAARLAGALAPTARTRRVGILGTRSIEAYIGLLAAGWAGSAYVPLNLKWPPERLVTLFGQLQLDALVADEAGVRLLSPEVLEAAPDFVVIPDKSEAPRRVPASASFPAPALRRRRSPNPRRSRQRTRPTSSSLPERPACPRVS